MLLLLSVVNARKEFVAAQKANIRKACKHVYLALQLLVAVIVVC